MKKISSFLFKVNFTFRLHNYEIGFLVNDALSFLEHPIEIAKHETTHFEVPSNLSIISEAPDVNFSHPISFSECQY